MVLGIGPLFVRDESCYVFLVNISHHGTAPQVALALTGLAGQYVAGKGIAPLDTAGSGFFEALGSAAIGLDFRHDFFSFCEK